MKSLTEASEAVCTLRLGKAETFVIGAARNDRHTVPAEISVLTWGAGMRIHSGRVSHWPQSFTCQILVSSRVS